MVFQNPQISFKERDILKYPLQGPGTKVLISGCWKELPELIVCVCVLMMGSPKCHKSLIGEELEVWIWASRTV